MKWLRGTELRSNHCFSSSINVAPARFAPATFGNAHGGETLTEIADTLRLRVYCNLAVNADVSPELVRFLDRSAKAGTASP